MSRNLKQRNLRAPSGLLAVALSTSLAFAACTTDRTLGNGDPVTTPGVRTTPTSGVGGSESAPTTPESNPPMMSSSALRSAPTAMSAAEAAARMVDNLPPVRVLGPSSPDAAERGYVSEGLETGQFIEPDPARSLDLDIGTESAVPVTGLAVTAENVVVPQLVQPVPPMLPESSAMNAATRTLRPTNATSGTVRVMRTSDGRVVVTNGPR